MKINNIKISFLLLIVFISCDNDKPPYEKLSDSKDEAQIYFSQALNNINFLETYSRDDEANTPPDSIKLNVGYGALGLPANNIEIKLEQDMGALDSINSIRKINGEEPYKPFPEDAYDIGSLNLEIPSGGEYSNYTTFIYYPEKFDLDQNYLLALSIVDASGYSINPSKRSVIFGVSEVDIVEPGIDLTVMSYAVSSGYKDLEEVAKAINKYNPDFLVVRQLDKNTARSGPADLPTKLGGLIEISNNIHASALDYQGGDYGAAIYSKFPIESSTTSRLPSTRNEKGPLGIITVNINEEQKLTFAGTQLDYREAIQGPQADALVDIMGAYTENPVILAGNFNAVPVSSDTYQSFATQFSFPCTTCRPNFPKSKPKTHSDFIMFKPSEKFEVISYEVGDSSVSRHLPVILKVRLLFD